MNVNMEVDMDANMTNIIEDTNQDQTTNNALTPSPKRLKKDEDDNDDKKNDNDNANEKNPRPFNLWAALVSQPDIIFHLTTQFLEPDDFCTLYAISKPLHYLVNRNYTAYIVASARVWAGLPAMLYPKRAYEDLSDGNEEEEKGKKEGEPRYTTLLDIFPHTAYAHFCVLDPSRRTDGGNNNNNNDDNDTADTATTTTTTTDTNPPPPPPPRAIPTFRYLRLLTYRARIIRSIIHLITQHYSHPLPLPHTAPVLAKLWLTLDIPTNAGRIALWHNRQFFRDEDIRLAMLFIVKLDLCFADPVDGKGQMGFRRMVIGQKGLGVLEGVLKRRIGRTPLEIMRMWVRWAEPTWLERRIVVGGDDDLEEVAGGVNEDEVRKMSVLGVPAGEIGALGCEGWTAGQTRLLGLEELCIMEGIKRGLKLEMSLIDMMLWGYVEKEKEAAKMMERMRLG